MMQSFLLETMLQENIPALLAEVSSGSKKVNPAKVI
jgi:hypothetical protein